MSYIVDGKKLVSYVDDDQLDVVVPKGIETIGREAFEDSNVRSVSLPDSVRKIDYFAFSSCKNLREIRFGCNTKLILDSAFERCQNLRTIDIPATVEEIGFNAFKDCSALETVSISSESSMKTICSGAFKGCSNLKHIDLPTSISYIGKECFKGCKNLTGTIVIPEKCRIVDKETFSECLRINAIVLPPSLKGIGAFAFFGCRGLSSITIPGSVKIIGSNAFHLCDGLETVIIQKGVQVIGNNAFLLCQSLENINIPDSIKDIGMYAFEYCRYLEHIELPFISKIRRGLFLSSGLRSIVIPESVTEIEKFAFSSCMLESIVLHNGVKSIGEGAFRDCRLLTSIKIPRSVESIGFSVFADCDRLSEVVLAEGLKEIERFAFVNCTSLKRITLPGTLEFISPNSFDGDLELEEICVNGYSMYYTSKDGVLYRSKREYLVRCPPAKKEVTIPDTVIGFSNDAFRACRQIKNISIPASVGTLDTKSFSSCQNLEYITVDENNKSYCAVAGLLYNKEKTSLIFCPPKIKIKEISIPDTVKRIEDHAFERCRLIRSVILPDGLEYIGHSAFRGCTDLVDIIIPESVSVFGGFAFEETAWLTVQRKENPMVIINHIIVDGRACSGDITIRDASRIGDLAFHNSAIKSITFSQEVHFIGDGAFTGCRKLERQILPESILEIGDKAFQKCSGLKKVTMHEDMLWLEDHNGWFDDDIRLSDIEVTHSANRIKYDSVDGAVYELDDNGQPAELIICPPGKRELYIPKGVKSIAKNAFCSCVYFADLHLPDSLSFKNAVWYDKLCESKKKGGMLFVSKDEEEHGVELLIPVTFYCRNNSEAYLFAKENHINVVIEENSSDNNTEN